jgi:hypothetical protein
VEDLTDLGVFVFGLLFIIGRLRRHADGGLSPWQAEPLQSLHVDDNPRVEQGHSLHHMAQLTHIARPGILA